MEGDFALKADLDLPVKPEKLMDQQDSTTAEPVNDSCPMVENGKEMNEDSLKDKMSD